MAVRVKLPTYDTGPTEALPWEGLTQRGNLTHLATRQIENAIAEVVGAQDCLEQMQIQMAVLTRAQERALRRCWLSLGDLRYLRPECSARRLQERADEWREEHDHRLPPR